MNEKENACFFLSLLDPGLYFVLDFEWINMDKCKAVLCKVIHKEIICLLLNWVL